MLDFSAMQYAQVKQYAVETAVAESAADPPRPKAVSRPKHRWAINGDFVRLKPTGVARYAREVTAALDQLVGEDHPLTRNLDLELVSPAPIDLKAIKVRLLPEFRSPRIPQFWVQAQLPRAVRGGLLSFCNLAPIHHSKHIACIHDLHTLQMPESYGYGFRLAHKLVLPRLGRTASRITTVSNLSRDHLISNRIADPEKIVVTYNGSDHVSRWDASKSAINLTNERPFVLFLGRSQKYKNNELIGKLAAPLDALGIDICVAGDYERASFGSAAQNAPNILHLGRISDDSLSHALNCCLCFLFPSRIEGFGLPAVEAMAHGCPLVASDAPCLPEVCGEAALYAGPDDVAAWLEAISRLRADSPLRNDLADKGRQRAKQFSWRRIAETYLGLIAEIEQQPANRGAGA